MTNSLTAELAVDVQLQAHTCFNIPNFGRHKTRPSQSSTIQTHLHLVGQIKHHPLNAKLNLSIIVLIKTALLILHTDNPVREWKRRACEEVLGLTAPVGKAPLVKAKANNSYSCHDLSC